jgi:hypothetical protein
VRRASRALVPASILSLLCGRGHSFKLRQTITRHTSHVTRHTSHVTRHTSHVTRHTSHVTRHYRRYLWPQPSQLKHSRTCISITGLPCYSRGYNKSAQDLMIEIYFVAAARCPRCSCIGSHRTVVQALVAEV